MINKPFICCIDTCKSICCDEKNEELLKKYSLTGKCLIKNIINF